MNEASPIGPAHAHTTSAALTSGYARAFAAAAVLCGVGALCSLVVPARRGRRTIDLGRRTP